MSSSTHFPFRPSLAPLHRPASVAPDSPPPPLAALLPTPPLPPPAAGSLVSSACRRVCEGREHVLATGVSSGRGRVVSEDLRAAPTRPRLPGPCAGLSGHGN